MLCMKQDLFWGGAECVWEKYFVFLRCRHFYFVTLFGFLALLQFYMKGWK